MALPPIQVAMVDLLRRLRSASDEERSTVAAMVRLHLVKTDEKGVQTDPDELDEFEEGLSSVAEFEKSETEQRLDRLLQWQSDERMKD